MTEPMHIDRVTWWNGRVKTRCGKTLVPGQGAPARAPLCPKCPRKAHRKGLPAFRDAP